MIQKSARPHSSASEVWLGGAVGVDFDFWITLCFSFYSRCSFCRYETGVVCTRTRIYLSCLVLYVPCFDALILAVSGRIHSIGAIPQCSGTKVPGEKSATLGRQDMSPPNQWGCETGILLGKTKLVGMSRCCLSNAAKIKQVRHSLKVPRREKD